MTISLGSAAAKGSLTEHWRVVRRDDSARDATGSDTAADRARVRHAIRGGRRWAPGGRRPPLSRGPPARAFFDLTMSDIMMPISARMAGK
jgi:hypothetical protein